MVLYNSLIINNCNLKKLFFDYYSKASSYFPKLFNAYSLLVKIYTYYGLIERA